MYNFQFYSLQLNKMGKITKTTLNFLSNLKSNNDREWFKENKSTYELSNNEVIAFADDLIERMNKFDKIETPNGKKSLYRIYRDVRFSQNKDPYKTNRSGSFAREGAERRGGYYFSIEPGNSMIGGGFYMPNKDDLNLIRKQIELDASPLRDAINSKQFINYYGTLLGEKLKTAPRGFAKDDPNLDLLQHKSFYVMHRFTDKEVLSSEFEEKVADGFKKLNPFFDTMTSYLTTNLDGESIL